MTHANDNTRPAIVTNSEPLRFLSVCSGIEAASVAWPQWQAVAFSEIENFPSAVLAHHYPDVPNLGDFTKIDTSTLGRVDILAGGTPCQAFSVAGLRGGLEDARGNLTLKFVELAHALADGNGLRNVVWENVVGVLSDKGNAFGCFLGGLVGADTSIEPPTRGNWGCAGLVSGPKGRAAWRVCDAQYWGVAQRRRRVIVVADFGNGADPAEVLFEREGVQRHTPPSREARQETTGSVKSGVGGGSWPAEISPTLNAAFGDKQGLEEQRALNGAGLFVPQTVAIRGRKGGATAELDGEVATALRASQFGGDKPHVLAFQSSQSGVRVDDVHATLDSNNGSRRHNGAFYGSAVRRLTPLECERLMGFPDGYTAIPWRGKPASECHDGPRYKALGNSWAVPLFAWLGRRIDMHMPRTAANDNKESARAA